MRPGRYPLNHPLERKARAELRAKTGIKPIPTDRDLARWTTAQPRRWGTPPLPRP